MARLNEPTNVTTTLLCEVPPSADDLEHVLAHLSAAGATVGVVHGSAGQGRAAFFRGCSADKSLLLGNRCLGPVYSLDLASYAGRSVEDVCAALALGSCAAYCETPKPMDGSLSPALTYRRRASHLYGMVITGADYIADWRFLRNHALHRAMKAADDLRRTRPTQITCLPP